MLRTIATLLFSFFFSASFAQDLQGVQRSIASNDWKLAKTQVDNYLLDTTHLREPGAWYYKGKIYTELSKTSYGDEKLLLQQEALASFKKYQDLDSSNKMMELDKNVDLFRIYDASYNEGISLYNEKHFEEAFRFFKNALDAKDYIYVKGFTLQGFAFPLLDTQLVNLAAMTAWQMNREEDAIHYFELMAASRLKAKQYKPVYGLLAGYHLSHNIVGSRTVLTIGKQLFPDPAFWSAVEVSGLPPGSRPEAYEELLKKHPDHAATLLFYAHELMAAEKGSSVTAQHSRKMESLLDRLFLLNKNGLLNPYEKMQLRSLVSVQLERIKDTNPERADLYRTKLKNL